MTTWASYVSVWLGIVLAGAAVLRGLVKVSSYVARLVDSTEANTEALRQVTATIATLSLRVDAIERQGKTQP